MYKRVTGFSVTQSCFWKSSEKTDLFFLTYATILEVSLPVLQIFKYFVKRGNLNRNEWYSPYQCPTASHWSADCHWRQGLLFLCFFVLWFKLQMMFDHGLLLIQEAISAWEGVLFFISSDKQPVPLNLSLCVCVIGALSFSFSVCSPSVSQSSCVSCQEGSNQGWSFCWP